MRTRLLRDALPFVALTICLISCNFSAPQPQTNTNAGGATPANGNAASTNGNTDTARGGGQPTANVAGNYRVTGRNQDGSPYTGTLTITARGPVYHLAWQTGQNYEGTGIAQADSLAVGWGGATCTVASYRIQPDGTLEGQWTTVGQAANLGTERATRSGGTAGGDIAGTYTIIGRNPNAGNASDYSGTLTITPRGSVYQFSWETAGRRYEGIGIRQGNTIAVGWGAEQCGVANYQVGANNTLRGNWGVYGQNQSGTEEAVRQ